MRYPLSRFLAVALLASAAPAFACAQDEPRRDNPRPAAESERPRAAENQPREGERRDARRDEARREGEMNRAPRDGDRPQPPSDRAGAQRPDDERTQLEQNLIKLRMTLRRLQQENADPARQEEIEQKIVAAEREMSARSPDRPEARGPRPEPGPGPGWARGQGPGWERGPRPQGAFGPPGSRPAFGPRPPFGPPLGPERGPEAMQEREMREREMREREMREREMREREMREREMHEREMHEREMREREMREHEERHQAHMQRLEHLHQAAEHLRHGEFGELLEHVTRRIHEMEREIPRPPGHPEQAPGPAFGELQDQINDLRRAVEELREQLHHPRREG